MFYRKYKGLLTVGGLQCYQALSPTCRLSAPTPVDALPHHALRDPRGCCVMDLFWSVTVLLKRMIIVDYVIDLPARARSRFGRHLARGESAERRGRAMERTRRRAARDCREAREAGACVRPLTHVHNYPPFVLLCDSLSGFLKPQKTRLFPWNTARCVWSIPINLEAPWDIVPSGSRRLTWIAMDFRDLHFTSPKRWHNKVIYNRLFSHNLSNFLHYSRDSVARTIKIFIQALMFSMKEDGYLDPIGWRYVKCQPMFIFTKYLNDWSRVKWSHVVVVVITRIIFYLKGIGFL